MKFSIIALIVLTVHGLALMFTTSFFVPDEYWQSLEVAHNIVYYYGYKTWEWQQGLRNYLYPCFIALIYQVLKICQLDSVSNLAWSARGAQAALSATGAALWVRWAGAAGAAGAAVPLFSMCTAWCWLYCAARTLPNAAEAALAAAALPLFPPASPPPQRGRPARSAIPFLLVVGLSVIIRPTAIIPWIPLCLYHITSSCSVIHTLAEYTLVGFLSFMFLVLLDTYFYGQFIITPFNFFHVNVYENVSDFYGSHSMNWYLFNGLPTVLGLHTIPFILGSIKCFRDGEKSPRIYKLLFNSIVFTLAVYSVLSHKEFRFILSVIPFALFISSSWLSAFFKGSNRFISAIVCSAFVVGSLVPLIYLGTFHQRGAVDVMHDLSQDAADDPARTSVLFLMPCHSTPLYSHLHVNVSVRFLTCDPRDVFHHNLPRDEADEFFFSPNAWLQKNLNFLPSHIVLFDVLYPVVTDYLSSMNFEIFNCYHHTHFPEGRVGSSVYLLKTKNVDIIN